MTELWSNRGTIRTVDGQIRMSTAEDIQGGGCLKHEVPTRADFIYF